MYVTRALCASLRRDAFDKSGFGEIYTYFCYIRNTKGFQFINIQWSSCLIHTNELKANRKYPSYNLVCSICGVAALSWCPLRLQVCWQVVFDSSHTTDYSFFDRDKTKTRHIQSKTIVLDGQRGRYMMRNIMPI